LHCGTLIDPKSTTVLKNQLITVKDGIIQSITNFKPNILGNVIDLSEKYCLPGFIDVHVHLTIFNWDKTDQ